MSRNEPKWEDMNRSEQKWADMSRYEQILISRSSSSYWNAVSCVCASHSFAHSAAVSQMSHWLELTLLTARYQGLSGPHSATSGDKSEGSVHWDKPSEWVRDWQIWLNGHTGPGLSLDMPNLLIHSRFDLIRMDRGERERLSRTVLQNGSPGLLPRTASQNCFLELIPN